MEAIITAIIGLAAATTAVARENLRDLYHVSEIDRVGFAPGLCATTSKGGRENVELPPVAHGPAIKAFHALSADTRIMERMMAQPDGVMFEDRGNTMRARGVSLIDLLPDFQQRYEDGVAPIAAGAMSTGP